MASLPLINNLKMDLIDNDEFKTGLTACSGIYLAKVSLNFYFFKILYAHNGSFCQFIFIPVH
jgi:hypothetical protein